MVAIVPNPSGMTEYYLEEVQYKTGLNMAGYKLRHNVKIHILESEGRLFKAHSDQSPSLRGRWELWESMPLPLSPEQSDGRLTSIF